MELTDFLNKQIEPSWVELSRVESNRDESSRIMIIKINVSVGIGKLEINKKIKKTIAKKEIYEAAHVLNRALHIFYGGIKSDENSLSKMFRLGS